MMDIEYWFLPTWTVLNFPAVIELFVRFPLCLTLLLLDRSKTPATFVFGLDMVGSTSVAVFLLLLSYLMITLKLFY